MAGKRSTYRRSGAPCWTMVATLAIGTVLFMYLVSPISAEDASDSPYSEAYSEEGENLTTPATPIRRFVWRVRNWMFHRNDEDTNIEVDSTEAAEPNNGEKDEGDCDGISKSRSWARSLAVWFARGIRNLLEQLYPREDSSGEGNSTEAWPAVDGTTGNSDDKPKDSDSGDSAIKPNRHHIFRPWTALPPPPPPGVTGSPPDSSSTVESTSISGTSPGYTKPSTSLESKATTVGSKGTTAGGKSTSGIKPSSDVPPKKPRRRRPKPTSTTTTTSEMPPIYSTVSTEEVFIQDTGNEIR